MNAADTSLQTPVTSADDRGSSAPDSAAPARGARAWPVVAAREVHVRLTDKNFLVSTVMTLVIMIGMFAAQGFIASRGSDTAVVTTTQQGADLAGRIGTAVHAANDKDSVRVQRVGDDAAARAAVESGSADVWLHGDDEGWTITTKNDTPHSGFLATTEQVVSSEALARNAAAVGTTPQALTAGSRVSTDQLQGSGTEMIVRMVTGFVLATMFYMVSLLFGLGIANSVVEEKQSRIVEIIASAVPLRQLLLGKVLGNTLLALGQMVLFVGAALIGLQFTQYKQYIGAISGPVGWFAAFFLVGFVALACLWAVAGSLASRSEDVQTTSQPMTMLILAAFFGGMMASGAPQLVLSFVPITSCVAMPMRLLQGDVPAWQPVLAVLLNAAFAALAIVLGERIYRRSILAGGGRVTWRHALTAQE